MDIFKINSLVGQKKWTELLNTLPEGEHKIPFPSIPDIKSCKATAYDMNSTLGYSRFTFNVNKGEVSAKITVKQV